MGFLSKVWKGVKKVVKKVVKPIAKIFKPITKFFNKFGVLGQIGMMFLMPYAFGALSSFGGAALNTIGGWSETLISASNWGAKALGHGLNLIHKAGTMVKNVYSSVTSTIKGAVDRTGNFLKGRGFVRTPNIQMNLPKAGEISMPEDLSKSLGERMDYQEAVNKSLAEAGSFKVPEGGAALKNRNLMDVTVPSVPTIDSSSLKMPDFSITNRIADNLNLENFDNYRPITVETLDAATGTVTTTDAVRAFNNPPVSAVPKTFDVTKTITPTQTKGVVDWVKTQASNLNPFNPDGTLRTKIREFDAGEFVVDSGEKLVQGGIIAGGQEAIAEDVYELLGGKRPEPAPFYSINVPGLANMASNDYTVFDSVNLMQTQNGNAWMASNYANANSINNFVDSSINYNNYMGQFGRSMYDSTI